MKLVQQIQEILEGKLRKNPRDKTDRLPEILQVAFGSLSPELQQELAKPKRSFDQAVRDVASWTETPESRVRDFGLQNIADYIDKTREPIQWMFSQEPRLAAWCTVFTAESLMPKFMRAPISNRQRPKNANLMLRNARGYLSGEIPLSSAKDKDDYALLGRKILQSDEMFWCAYYAYKAAMKFRSNLDDMQNSTWYAGTLLSREMQGVKWDLAEIYRIPMPYFYQAIKAFPEANPR